MATVSTEEPRLRQQAGAALHRWAGEGRRAAVVRVLERHGFGTVATGQLLAGTEDGERAGDLFAGTMDRVAVPLLESALSTPGTVTGHVTEPDAVDAGLVCAGGAHLLGHPLPADAAAALGAALRDGLPAALATPLDGSSVLVATGHGLDTVVGTVGSDAADDIVLSRVRGLARAGATATEQFDAGGVAVLLDVWVPVTTMLIVGRGALGPALAAQCDLLGWAVRAETEVEPTLAAVCEFTAADVLVLLDHSPAFDVVLIEQLRSGRGFCGPLGSRRTQAARRSRLLMAGVTEEELARMHAPVGLDIGAGNPAEAAVSIVAEVLAARNGRSGGPLSQAGGRIGG